MSFKDHFSARATLYAAYRPAYPEALFDILAALPARLRTALDCATGNGQAAIGLVKRFERVVATDASAEQIDNALPHPRIEYRVARADESGLPRHSVDLVTAAQALHWLHAPPFFAEAERVLADDGAIAIWGYGDPALDFDALDRTLREFNRGLLNDYWPPERKLLLDGYRSIDFPFEEVAVPTLTLEMHWTLAELAGYLRTWSATARYMAEHDADPVIDVEKALAVHWGDSQKPRIVRWPLYLRAGRIRRHDSRKRSG
ncbi:MAG: class I SAM-dependent methyltransferase [Gemmatimonadaceae bacterium]